MAELDEASTQHRRFAFGKNWRGFLATLSEERIAHAEASLRSMLGIDSLEKKSFLDIGSGSGLSSLAAKRLGAQVRSFDYDSEAVACTEGLKQRCFPGDDNWAVEPGDVMDREYLGRLGSFDIVYSWGVLHHTGHMWLALENVVPLVKSGGILFVAIYNDQGGPSQRWVVLKRLYNKMWPPFQFLITLAVGLVWELRALLGRVVRLQNPSPIPLWKSYKALRGMSYWHDIVDWVGGYPFEVAKPEQIFDFYRERGFVLLRLRTQAGGHGCNEFVFQRARIVLSQNQLGRVEPL